MPSYALLGWKGCIITRVLSARKSEFAAAVVLAVLEYWPRPSNAPPVLHSGGVPTIGNIVDFATAPVDAVRRGYDKLGNCFTMPLFGQKWTFVLGPQAHESFFGAADDEVSQADVYKFMTPVFGRGIVYDAPLRLMQQQLRIMSRSLQSGALKLYVPQIIEETERYFAHRWGDSGEVNLMEAMSELIILTASRCLMGKEIRETLFEQVADLYHDLDAGITPVSMFFPNAPIPQHFQRNRARKEMVRIFSSVIQRRRAAGDMSKNKDVLQAFMDAEYKDGTRPTDEQITGLMIALLFAGQHTSSITSTWTTMLILHHPDIMERVIAEQEQVVGQEELSYEKVQNMDVLHRCMKEAIRMFPPLIFLMRKVRKEQKVGDYVVPAGDVMVASPAVSHRLPEGDDNPFTNPEMFDPDRFAEGRREDQRAPRAFIGFGSGKHACMGENFGYLQVKTIVSTIFRNFRVTPVASAVPKPDYTAMVVGPKASQTRIRYERIVPATKE